MVNHIMVDLETLGTVPGCVILSIGAVVFDPITGNLGDEFYQVLNIEDCKKHFLTEDADTVAWWNRQSDAARQVLIHATDSKMSVGLKEGLERLNSFMKTQGGPKSLLVYGNGADFDNPILTCAYDAAKVKPAWASYNGRCYRTLKNLHELFGEKTRADKVQRGGTYHNALDDAKTQAVHLMDIVAKVRKAGKFA